MFVNSSDVLVIVLCENKYFNVSTCNFNEPNFKEKLFNSSVENVSVGFLIE